MCTPKYLSFLFIIFLISCNPDNENPDIIEPYQCSCDENDIHYIAINDNDTIFFNTAFSPNNDGDNEYWEFTPNNTSALEKVKDLEYKVYDKNKKILTKKGEEEIINNPMNAQINGKNIPSGCYRYKLYFEEELIAEQYIKVVRSFKSNDGNGIEEYHGCGCYITSQEDIKLQCDN